MTALAKIARPNGVSGATAIRVPHWGALLPGPVRHLIRGAERQGYSARLPCWDCRTIVARRLRDRPATIPAVVLGYRAASNRAGLGHNLPLSPSFRGSQRA